MLCEASGHAHTQRVLVIACYVYPGYNTADRRRLHVRSRRGVFSRLALSNAKKILAARPPLPGSRRPTAKIWDPLFVNGPPVGLERVT